MRMRDVTRLKCGTKGKDDASGSPSQTENGLTDLASRTVAKPSTQAVEEEALAQAEAAEQKLKFEQQDKISRGKHDDVPSESAQNLDDHIDSRNQTNEHGMCSDEIPSSWESDSAQGAIQNQMMEKFELKWSSKGKDILPNEKGDIEKAGRTGEQITLNWKSEPQTVLIITKPESKDAEDLCETIVRWLDFDKKDIYVEPKVKEKLLEKKHSFGIVKTWPDYEPGKSPDLREKHEKEKKAEVLKKVDLVITLGGDGTVLWAASLFQGPAPPVVSFALGSLGFMTPFSRNNYEKQLELILKGPFPITLRHRLQCQIVRHLADKEKAVGGKILVLNEVTIDRGHEGYLTNLECECDGSDVTLVQGDGLILSTTSGSTAYSLAAGGSMVHPQVRGILFTPICPHSLSFRPLILPEHVTIRVKVPPGSRSSAWVSFDGRNREELKAKDELICSMAQSPVLTACLYDSTRDFLSGIQKCLHWNLRKIQLPDGPQKP